MFYCLKMEEEWGCLGLRQSSNLIFWPPLSEILKVGPVVYSLWIWLAFVSVVYWLCWEFGLQPLKDCFDGRNRDCSTLRWPYTRNRSLSSNEKDSFYFESLPHHSQFFSDSQRFWRMAISDFPTSQYWLSIWASAIQLIFTIQRLFSGLLISDWLLVFLWFWDDLKVLSELCWFLGDLLRVIHYPKFDLTLVR